MIKTLLVDDQPLIREALRTFLTQSNEIEIIGTAESGRQALEMIRDTPPEVVIIDVRMPDMDGVESTFKIHKEHPDLIVIGLSSISDKHRATEMLQAGARGFLTKETPPAEIVEAVKKVVTGETVVSPCIFSEELARGVSIEKAMEELSSKLLTNREKDILRALASGLTNSGIAEKLFVSPRTVEKHRQNMMQKLELQNGVELVAYAYRVGIIDE
ncbi:MAG: response regulator transcription factor [Gammaproteobacteria bacterium]|jgi:DNA-binding NarL/FixJ family response regulator|nr:response regulator transcription factor [Gammaproteobacteria bacterium]MBT4608361.1 response regulator transcription factor [Thiotrichales bacterium]MBT3471729.1 response regulator transcription factor [Gammaproteobacteria bacterium]MBT3967329.1 response regulator transcription factor [Gammaproteobacteria bacterium]MBT4080748.1 response regulator transcription factor [Gammaproteobacteria bacterium]